MKLDTIALIVVAVGAGLYFLAILAGAIAASTFGFGIPLLILLLVGAYLVVRVIGERRSNAEDDYYENNVEK